MAFGLDGSRRGRSNSCRARRRARDDFMKRSPKRQLGSGSLMLIPPRQPPSPHVVAIPINYIDASSSLPIPLQTKTPARCYRFPLRYPATNPPQRTRKPRCPHAARCQSLYGYPCRPHVFADSPPMPDRPPSTNAYLRRTHALANPATACTCHRIPPQQLSIILPVARRV